MTDADLARILEPLRELDAAATPGPWPETLKNGAVVFVEYEMGLEYKWNVRQRNLVGRFQLFSPEDRAIIAASRNAITELLKLYPHLR